MRRAYTGAESGYIALGMQTDYSFDGPLGQPYLHTIGTVNRTGHDHYCRCADDKVCLSQNDSK
ncbi:hypothetical protein Fuma_04770 [Fuerstiella marisgermanici]|uniref:Uncharacterized protein n=1 Tax=Fuerstiella marisgermanici TaxID=1891926 RepID=A0A1P8WM40_9PLAN|nr:hypothetical protein Fuma_04770 [Fuerstiella marisgermanici]